MNKVPAKYQLPFTSLNQYLKRSPSQKIKRYGIDYRWFSFCGGKGSLTVKGGNNDLRATLILVKPGTGCFSEN